MSPAMIIFIQGNALFLWTFPSRRGARYCKPPNWIALGPSSFWNDAVRRLPLSMRLAENLFGDTFGITRLNIPRYRQCRRVSITFAAIDRAAHALQPRYSYGPRRYPGARA
jgi:hypothetical protein